MEGPPAANGSAPCPWIDVVGTDASGLEGLSEAWKLQLRQAGLVATPGRLGEELRSWLGAVSPETGAGDRRQPVEIVPTDRPTDLLPRLAKALAEQRRVVVLASGDPLWFGIGRVLLAHFEPEQLRFHPAPSSLQLAFARIGRPWQDASWVSLHGRDPEPLAAALQKRPAALAVLTDPERGGADAVRRILRASGLEHAYDFWVGERLGHRQERMLCLGPADPLPPDLHPLHLVLLVARGAARLSAPADLPLFGIADGLWQQHSDRPGLMTKREVRLQLLADLDLPASGVLWDIGAGVGSVGLEALRLRPGLALWAVERRSGGAELIAANAAMLGVRPAGVLKGSASDLLDNLPDPDRVLLGGGGRDRLSLLEGILKRLRPDGVVVIPLATLEALAELRPAMEEAGLEVAVSQHQAWRGAPLADGTRLIPLNPVIVLRGSRRRSG